MITDALIAKSSAAISTTLAVAGGVLFAATDAVIISITTSTAAVIMAGVSAYFAYKSKVISESTHSAVNSRLDLFMKTAEQLFHAQGKEQERAEERERKGIAAQATVVEIKKENIPPK